jgi:hypothetical protein
MKGRYHRQHPGSRGRPQGPGLLTFPHGPGLFSAPLESRAAAIACCLLLLQFLWAPVEATPGEDYTLYLFKLTEGEAAGYVSIYEGPVIDVKCPPPGSDVQGSSRGGGGGNPPGSGRARVNK